MDSAQYESAATSESYLGSEEETELDTEEETEGEEETTAETEEELDSSRLTDQNDENKIKEECIISDPSFSMVTVQREDSGITWETSSSRSSTPWASDSGLTSDMYSMEGSTVSSPPGNISFILDEGKKARKRTRKSSSKHGSPALRRKGGKKRHSLEGQADVPANAKGKASISDGKSEQEKSSLGTYDKTGKKKTVSNTPPITGAIYKEYKPLVLRPVYIGTVQYKIKMFNSVKEEIIPLQFYGTLPKGYVIKEINYRKGKDASITLEPDVTNQDASISSKARKPVIQIIESKKEKELSPPWRQAVSKEARPAPSLLKDIEKPKETDSYSPLNTAAVSGLKHTVSSYSSNETKEPQSLPLSASTLPTEEASMHDIQTDSPDAITSELMSPKTVKEELKADTREAVVLSPTLSISPSFVDKVGEEERESDLLATATTSVSENFTSAKAEEEAFESDSLVTAATAPGPLSTKVENLELSSLEKEEAVSPSGEWEMDETKPESSVSSSEPPALGEMKEEEEGVSLPITSGLELEPSSVSEEIIEIDYPESPYPSENAILPHLVHEGEREEDEPDLPLLATSTSEHVTLLEKEREEIGPISPDSDFASEFSSLSYSTHELEEKETESVSPPAIMSASEGEILSEAETVPYSPEVTSVSEYSTISPTAEEESIGCETPTPLASTSEATIFSEEETLESERYTPDSTSASEYSIPPYMAQESQKEETGHWTPLSSVATAEQMIISEDEKDDIGPFSPDSAFVSEYSLSPHAVRESEKEEFERDYPLRSTSPSEHTILTEEGNEEIEPFSPDSASDFSVSPYTIPEPGKNDSEAGSLQTATSALEYSIFSEAENEDIEPDIQAATMPDPEHTILSQRQKAQHSSSVPGSEQLNLSPSTAEAEKGEVKPSSQTTSTSVSEYLILSEKQKMEGSFQALESEHSIPPSSTDEREKEEIRPDSSVPASMKTGLSEKEKLKPVLPETSVTRPQESIPPESSQEVKKELGPEPAHAQKGASEHLAFSKVSKEEIMPSSQATPPEYPASLQHKEMEPHSPRSPEYVMKPSVAPGEAGKKVGSDSMSTETPVPQQETSLKDKENLKDIQKAKSLAEFGVSQAEPKERVRQDKEQAAIPESQHLALSKSEKEETPHLPELKFSSLSEENNKEIGPDSPQAVASELKPSHLPKVVKEEIQSDSSLSTTSVFDSVLSKASKDEAVGSSPPTEHLARNEKEKEAAESSLLPIETTASKSPIWSEVHKEVNFHVSPNASYSAEHAVLSEVVKEEEKPGSSVPEHSVLSKAGSDQGVPPRTVPPPEWSTLLKKQASEASTPASVTGGSVPPYVAVEMEKKDTELSSSKTVMSASDQRVPSQEKEEIKYPPNELETLGTEELSMKSVTSTSERSRQEPATLISNKNYLPSEKSVAVPSSGHPVEPEKAGVLLDALELSGSVSELSQDLVSEKGHSDATLELSLTSETGSSVLERAKSETKTREEGEQVHKPLSAEVASVGSDKSVPSFIGKENTEPQQDHVSLEELSQESRDLPDSNKGEKQKGHPLTSTGNLFPQRAGDISTKTNEDITQIHSFPISENVPEPSQMASSGLSDEHAKPSPEDANFPAPSTPSSGSPLADEQDVATKSHSFAEANLPLEELRSIVTIEPRDVIDAENSLPSQKEGSWLLKEPSPEQASPDKERVLESEQLCSSATDGRILGQLTSASSEKKQTYEPIEQESLYPANEADLLAHRPASPLGRTDDQREKLTSQTYSSPEIQVDEEPRGSVLVENVGRAEANRKQLSLTVEPESVIPEKLGAEEDGQEKFTPISESATKIQTRVSGDHVREHGKSEIIHSSIKTTSCLAEGSVPALGSEKEDLGSAPYSSTEKRQLEESKADTSKVKSADEAWQSESKEPLPEAKISMQETSKLSLIQSGEITTPLDSPEITNKVPEQAETATPSTVTHSKVRKGVSSFTSWMASLFFGASASENDVDEQKTPPSPAADTAVLEGEVKTTVPVTPDDFNEAEKPAPSPLSVSGLLPEKEPKVILIKASEEREQKETPLTLPSQEDKELSKMTLLRGEKVSQKSEPLPTHHLPEAELLSGVESRTALTESGKPRQSKEEPMLLSVMEETPPELSKSISGELIEEHKMPEAREEEKQSLSGIRVEMPSEEPASVRVTSTQNGTCLEHQSPLLRKQLVSEEAEYGAPVHTTGDNKVQKAEIYTPAEKSQLTEESKSVLTYLDEQQYDQEKTLVSPVKADQVKPKSTPSEFAVERTMKESAKLESRTLTMEESKDSLTKVGDDRPEKEMPKAVSSPFYDDESNLKTISSTDDEKVLEQKPYRIMEKDVLEEKSEMAVPLLLRDTKEIRMAGLLQESELHKVEYSKEPVLQFCENKEDKGTVVKTPIEVSMMSEATKSAASISSENQLSFAKRGMREDSKPHLILGSREVSEELGMTLGSSVDESQPLSFAKADFFKESQIASLGPTEKNKEESSQSPLAEKEKLVLGRSDAITISPEEEGEQKESLPNLSPGENNQMTQPYSAGRTNFASEESGITFGISHDETENLKNQTYSKIKAKSVTEESQIVLSMAHPEIKETKTVGMQPTSLSEIDSLEEKTSALIPTSPGHRVKADQEDICALPDIGSVTSKILSDNKEKEYHSLSSEIPHAVAEPSEDALLDITKESKKQESQPKLGTFSGLVSRESKMTLNRPFDETGNLDQLSSFPETIFSPVKSSAVISVSSSEVNVSDTSEISSPELTGAGQAPQTKDGAPDSPVPPTFVSKPVSDSQAKPMGDLQVDKPDPSAIRDSDRVTCVMPSTNGEEISSTEGIAKEPENLFVKDEAFAAPVVTSKPPGLTEDQKNAFSIIAEGCEILNIHAPAFISSVDEEECEKMQDKLEYLEEKTSQSNLPFHDGSKVTVGQETVRNESHAGDLDADVSLEKGQMQEKTHSAEEDISTDSDVAFSYHTMPSDVDYFEKYTLIDYNIFPEPLKKESFQKQDTEREPQKKVPEGTISFPENSADKTLECEFDLVKLDESFYGMEKDDGNVSYTESQPPLPTLSSTDSETSRNIARDVEAKSPGMPLFKAEEGVLSRTQLFPTEVKAINPELLEEPPALAFLYKDLYEEAVGDKKREGETTSDRESLNSDASFPSRHSDAEEGTGMYFEKYILKDDILHDVSGYQKDQSQPLEEIPVGKDDSCQLITGEGEVWGRFGTIFGEKSMEEEHKAVFSEGELRSSVENQKDGEVQRKMPITEEVQLASQKISYAVPFQDTHHILERVDEPDGQGNEEENASPEASQHFPVEVSYPEEELMSGATPAPESLQVEPQVSAPPEMPEERPRSSPVQDEYEFAELMNYEVVPQEEVLSDDLFSESTPEDVLSQGKESFELIGENDEFAKEVEQSKSVLQKDSGPEVVEPEPLLAQAEDAQKETKKSQIDTYCYTCKCPISAIDKIFGAHKDHEVVALDTAIDVVKIQLGECLENLKEKSLKIEAFVTEIEAFFNTIEENCSKNEKRLEEQNEEMMKKVLAQYDERAQSFEEVKRRKMDYLHEQMVSFLQSMDTAKETLEAIVKEAEELDETVFLTSFKEINDRLLSAMESTASLENIPTAFSLFEHYDDSSTRSDQMVKHVAVPQPPTLEPQEPNSATSTTITVYWSVRKEDVVDSFQVYCMEEPREDSEANDLVEEYRLTVKESYCLFEDLEPGRCYQVWVMAVNFTGCSLPSERATFKTAPSTPIIKAEYCTVCWNTATIRWSSANPRAADAYTLEYCRQHSPEGEGLRSYSGIKGFQLKVNLQPNDNYFFYAKAVNAFGTSEQSEAALISTRGTRFLLLRETAHPALQISSDGTVIRFTERRRLTETPSVLGEQLPACGQHYWETTVTDCPAYRLGICSSSNMQGGALGQGDTSWYMHCSEPQRYKFFSNGTVSNVHVTEHVVRVGILLDYSNQRLLFINAESGQLLFTIRHRFMGPTHPAFALEKPGQFTLHLGKEPPDFLRHK